MVGSVSCWRLRMAEPWSERTRRAKSSFWGGREKWPSAVVVTWGEAGAWGGGGGGGGGVGGGGRGGVGVGGAGGGGGGGDEGEAGGGAGVPVEFLGAGVAVGVEFDLDAVGGAVGPGGATGGVGF